VKTTKTADLRIAPSILNERLTHIGRVGLSNGTTRSAPSFSRTQAGDKAQSRLMRVARIAANIARLPV
jgi:hypothetical protein